MLDFIRKRIRSKELPTIDKEGDSKVGESGGRLTRIGKDKPRFTWGPDEPDYIKLRLGPFINFYEEQRKSDRLKERILQFVIMGLGASIPIINVIGIQQFYANILSAIFGGAIASLTAVLQFEKYHEKWLSFKQVNTKLSNEYFMWNNCSGVYSLQDDKIQEKIKLMIEDRKELQQQSEILTNLTEDKIREKVEKKIKLALLVERCEGLITSEAFDYVALFSTTNLPRQINQSPSSNTNSS